MSDYFIHADKLSLIRGQRLLFKRLSFSLSAGHVIHLSGHNGSGKTSLFTLLTGILTPDSGQLRVFNKNPRQFEADDHRHYYYLGHHSAVKPELSAIENLTLSTRLFDGIHSNQQQLMAALAAVGLAEYAQQSAAKLSAGQQRRIMLARLWCGIDSQHTQKKLWLLDEPFTALDPTFSRDLAQLIDQHLALGGGAVITAHQPLTLQHPVQSLNISEQMADTTNTLVNVGVD